MSTCFQHTTNIFTWIGRGECHCWRDMRTMLWVMPSTLSLHVVQHSFGQQGDSYTLIVSRVAADEVWLLENIWLHLFRFYPNRLTMSAFNHVVTTQKLQNSWTDSDSLKAMVEHTEKCALLSCRELDEMILTLIWAYEATVRETASLAVSKHNKIHL